jgi:hypothetical protein
MRNITHIVASWIRHIPSVNYVADIIQTLSRLENTAYIAALVQVDLGLLASYDIPITETEYDVRRREMAIDVARDMARQLQSARRRIVIYEQSISELV